MCHLKPTVQSTQSLTKFQWHFSQKKNLKFCMYPQKILKNQSNPKKEQSAVITLLDFKLYYTIIVKKKKTAWYSHKIDIKTNGIVWKAHNETPAYTLK